MLNDLLPQESASPPAPQRARSLTKTWLRRSSITAGIAAMALTAAGAVSLGLVNSNIERADLMSISAAAAPQSAKDALNIVILGSVGEKTDTSETSRGDVVMVLHISADRESAQLISFPRATYVTVPGKGMNTLNKAYELGGTKLVVRTLETLTKTRMDHVMLADYQGFTALAQQVGAVTITNEEAFSNLGFSFAKGEITLDGPAALAYVKARTDGGDAAGDMQERQRLVLEAGLQKGLSRELLSSPAKLTAFVNTASQNVVVDKKFTATAITKIALSLKLTEDDVALVRAPLTSDQITFKGQKVQKVDSTQFQELASAMAGDTLSAYVEKYPSN